MTAPTVADLTVLVTALDVAARAERQAAWDFGLACGIYEDGAMERREAAIVRDRAAEAYVVALSMLRSAVDHLRDAEVAS